MELFVPWLRKNGFWGHLRSPESTSGSFVVKKWKNFHIGYKYMKLKLLTSALRKNNFRGHLRSPEPKSGSFGVKTRKFSNIGLWYMKMKVSELWFRKNGSRCHLRSPKPKSGSFGVKTRKFFNIELIYMKLKRFELWFRKKMFSRSSKVTRAHIGAIRSKIKSPWFIRGKLCLNEVHSESNKKDDSEKYRVPKSCKMIS